MHLHKSFCSKFSFTRLSRSHTRTSEGRQVESGGGQETEGAYQHQLRMSSSDGSGFSNKVISIIGNIKNRKSVPVQSKTWIMMITFDTMFRHRSSRGATAS